MQVEQINGMTDFTLKIPIKIRAGASVGAHDIMFNMTGPRGWSFGETLTVKLKVLPTMDHMAVFLRVK
jgi:hypothetical protein